MTSVEQLNSQFGVGGDGEGSSSVSFEHGPSDQTVVRLRVGTDSSPSSSSTIHLHGAHVTSYVRQGKELFFLSKSAVFRDDKGIRGGIPVIFPQFGPGVLPQHGFARTAKWHITSTSRLAGNGVRVVLSLTDSPSTRAMWDYAFAIDLVVTLTGDSLETELKAKNTGTRDFSFTTALHTYFATSDITKLSIPGLTGVSYIDKTLNLESFVHGDDSLTFDKETDRVYANTPNTLSIIRGGEDSIVIKKTNFPDAVIWNPWVAKAKAMSDFDDDGYKRMVCVEVAATATPVPLAAGQDWSATQVITSTAAVARSAL
eukprot:TRINITY_DN3412_c2_g5_i1.p1 TRINITY_DN3412_c2_g5~~TRINITY_DN3412_c2_g5_i1.p1  ORF type:complete len:321 (+),score=65.07 TRINITY_DN3412_c2_g5_i1:22-963(+)